jgi:hypothetical protein
MNRIRSDGDLSDTPLGESWNSVMVKSAGQIRFVHSKGSYGPTPDETGP